MKQNSSFIIVDGYGFIFRAFHVQPALTSSNGQAVGAVYGFTSMLLKILSDFKPKHAVIVFDAGGKNFRHELDANYKANRPALSQDLIDQFPLVRQAATSLNFTILEKKGFEADDLIATLAVKAAKSNNNAIIISADKDLMQLINGHIQMYDPLKNKYITANDVIEKFGVGPESVREVMALMGDKSDNIPGVPGFGPKTAAELIKQFGTVENLINNFEQIKNDRQREILRQNIEQANLSWQLVGLDKAVDIEFDINQYVWQPPKLEKIASFLNEYDFKSLNKRVEKLFNIAFKEQTITSEDQFISSENAKVEIVEVKQLNGILEQARRDGTISLYLNVVKNQGAIHVGVSKINYLIKFEYVHAETGKANELFSDHKVQDNYWFIEPLKKIFADNSVKKIIYDLKVLLNFLNEQELSQNSVNSKTQVSACDDLKLLQYLISAGKPQIDLAAPKDEHHILAVSDFQQQFRQFKQIAIDQQIFKLYTDIDLPLLFVLQTMEDYGVKIDAQYLQKLSVEFTHEISVLEEKIFAESGTNFNIGSPKQLGEILFDKMQLPPPKILAKSKSYSTGVDVLESLSEHGYLIADLILNWRQFTKLKNTYTDALQTHINTHSGRVHTTFLQTSTTTGRLSSVEPNLQNIPIRSDEGNKIRAAFIAKAGYKLLSADYSQIELRILAHMADIPVLTQAFINNEDIHSQTAMRIFKVSKEELNSEHRRKAKAINFGIIYGISGFGLARQLAINASEGKKYIQKYMEEFPGIKEYMDATIDYARQHGYVVDLLGRKCYVPTINDKNHLLRQIAERAAINAPIQGTNADIIKIAMINISEYLTKNNFSTKLILQIHDELLFEVPEDELTTITPLIKNIMEKAIKLSVPIIVETKIGDNWRDVK